MPITRIDTQDLGGVVSQIALKFSVAPPFKRSKKFVIADTRVKLGSRLVFTRTFDPAFDILNGGEDELEMDDISFNAVAFDGGFNLYVVSTGPIWGWICANYIVGT